MTSTKFKNVLEIKFMIFSCQENFLGPNEVFENISFQILLFFDIQKSAKFWDLKGIL